MESTDRLKQAVARAVANGYAETIKRNMARRNLPPQLFYLALQESGFDAAAVGPKPASASPRVSGNSFRIPRVITA